MPPVRKHDRPRQDPVSCQICRRKKLKCDRKLPCSSCRSRNLLCEYDGERPSVTDNRNDDDLRAENLAIKARLDRLEQALYNSKTPIVASPEPQVLLSLPAKTAPLPRTEATQADEDSQWLETLSARTDVVLPPPSARVAVQLQSMEQLLLASDQLPEARNISMPTYDVAVLFLDAYAKHLDATSHILHIDSTRQVFDRAYGRLANSQDVDPGALCLILSICASVAYYATVGSSCGETIFNDLQMVLPMALFWAKQGLYAMEQIHMTTTTTPTLEAIQSVVLLTFVFYHIEGFTCRVRLMHSSGITMARSLDFHKTDLADGRPPPSTQSELIDREVRRMVWWHLTSTDWILSFVGGPQEGIYSIGPQNMEVKVPQNLNQQDLNTQGPNFSRPLSEPTGMAYYLQRIKLATTCREVADTLWKSIRFMDPVDVDYNIVAVLDAKFDAQLRELPRFMHLDIASSQLQAEYGELFTPSLDIQRILIHLMVNSRRCQLHMPFLIRAKTDQRFKRSRAVGLQSARAVFAARRFALQDTQNMGAVHLKLGGLLQVG